MFLKRSVNIYEGFVRVRIDDLVWSSIRYILLEHLIGSQNAVVYKDLSLHW